MKGLGQEYYGGRQGNFRNLDLMTSESVRC